MKYRLITFITSIVILAFLACEKEDSNTPPEKPISLKGESYTCETLRPTLTWSCHDEDYNKLSYTLRFGESPDNLKDVVSSLYTEQYTFSYDLSASTKYYWQIIVRDRKSRTEGDIWDFTTISDPVESNAPSTPKLLSPKDDTQAGDIEFSWEEVTDDGGSESILYKLSINDMEYELVGITKKTVNLTVGEYSWYVTAVDEDGNEAESENVKINII